MSKSIRYNKRFKFNPDVLEYTFKVKPNRWKWLWWLLPIFLLLLLLMIPCRHEVNVKTIDRRSNIGIPDVTVMMSYTSHYFLKNGEFFVSEAHADTVVTDEDGRAKFDDIKCSVYSYVFCCLSKAIFKAGNGCYQLNPDPNACAFHYTWNKTLPMSPKTTDVDLEVVDKETDEPLAGAVIKFEYEVGGEEVVDSLLSDASGRVTFSDIPQCARINASLISCYGYKDITNVELSVPAILSGAASSKIQLAPLKESFSYFVRNKFTKEPVPNATVEVTLTTQNGQVIRGRSRTNVDGKGRGAYKDGFVLATVSLLAKKLHYKDGKLERRYTVEQFAGLHDSLRVVYLEPEPYMEEFQNIDSISGKPISGVDNHIQRASIDGNAYEENEVSNRNGIFYVKAMEGDQLGITSQHIYYEDKHTQIERFDEGEKILMMPKRTEIAFRTVDEDTWELLPDCQLAVTTSLSGITRPTNSGNGKFVVEGLYYGERISIIAYKRDYITNSYTIYNSGVIELSKAPQRKRDIPLKIDLPPCNGGESEQSNVAAGAVSNPRSYNMGTNRGIFALDYYTGNNCPDCVDVYNHKAGETPSNSNKIWSSGMVTTGDSYQTQRIRFNNGSVITIIVTTGPRDGSAWSYHVHCPQ